MTNWKCPDCAGERETENNIVMTICPCCQVEMKKFPHNHKKEVEVNYGNL